MKWLEFSGDVMQLGVSFGFLGCLFKIVGLFKINPVDVQSFACNIEVICHSYLIQTFVLIYTYAFAKVV